MIDLRQGDCRAVMRQMVEDGVQVDAVVCDPPYGFSFMNQHWDADVPGPEYWELALALLKPGGYLLAFSGPRTHHRMATAIEQSGFEIRDQIVEFHDSSRPEQDFLASLSAEQMDALGRLADARSPLAGLFWTFGSGFPKSQNVGKAIDKKAGAEREVVGPKPYTNQNIKGGHLHAGHENKREQTYYTAPATDEAKQWDGWGTALKPAHEPIVVARKPLGKKTIAENVLAHGTGAINIDACRVPMVGKKGYWPGESHGDHDGDATAFSRGKGQEHEQGRWPANLLHDSSPEATAPMGDAARYFYCAKAAKKDRDEGLDDLPVKAREQRSDTAAGAWAEKGPQPSRNTHPTVKPTSLMAWLVRLACREGGVVLDPFMGSGSTGKACARERVGFIGIEREAEYIEIARRRIAHEAAKNAPSSAEPEDDPQTELFSADA